MRSQNITYACVYDNISAYMNDEIMWKYGKKCYEIIVLSFEP